MSMFQTGSPVTFAYSKEIEVSQSSAGDTGVSSAEWTAVPLTGLKAWALRGPWFLPLFVLYVPMEEL